MQNFSVVLQAGGQSRRMGTDKGLLPFGDVTLIEYILAQVKSLGSEQFIISNKPQDYARLGLPVVTDVIPDVGALGGVYTAVYHAKFQKVLVLACDMPFVNLELTDYLLGLAENHDVVVPQQGSQGWAEPFRSVYSKACMPAIEAALERGDRKVVSFLDEMDVRYVTPEEVHRFDPEERSFFNVNTRDDLERALILANN
jgi:molybdopterin-guanine dinucleotide biosynthesis protein A